MLKNSKDIGENSEAQVLAALLKKGKTVLKPFGDNQRYDLVIDENGEFIRIQCKTGRYILGCIVFDTCSSAYHRGGKKKHYRGDADLFGVYCSKTDKVYIIPVEDVAKTWQIFVWNLQKMDRRKIYVGQKILKFNGE